ncbi:MAG: hypothetical protein WC242_02205 [Candidatus Paceibacterota bacterium]
MPNCTKCNDTGIVDTGNNDLPCDCPAGATTSFNIVGVKGSVTGAEIWRHFMNGSPEPIARSSKKEISVLCLPGREG